MKTDLYPIGDFKIESGSAYLTDPCYKVGTWCMAKLENVKNGKWRAYVQIHNEGAWGNRVSCLMLTHESVPELSRGDQNAIISSRVKIDAEVGVDSGQAGMFDAEHYRKNSSIPEDFNANAPRIFKSEAKEVDVDDPDHPSRFYAACCDRTLGPSGKGGISSDFFGGGTIPFGAVSSSGYGDGGYDAYTCSKDGEIVAVEIVFISDEEDEEEEEEYDDGYGEEEGEEDECDCGDEACDKCGQ